MVGKWFIIELNLGYLYLMNGKKDKYNGIFFFFF